MELQILRHLWGLPGSLAVNLPQLRQIGYDGVEAALPPREERPAWRELFHHTKSQYVAQIFTTGLTVREHLLSFRQQIAEASILQPVLITSHDGSDAWPYEDNLQFCREAVRIEADLGIPIAHETHRGRIFFHPWVTQRLVTEVAGLWLCADFSHWVCVCERLLEDQQSTMAVCMQRTRHIHARVGYEEGPQVPDPRDPAYAYHGAIHQQWWDHIWDVQQAQGFTVTTLTPEFGPSPYLHTVPYTQMPVSDLSRICDWQAERQRQRFLTRSSR